MVSIHVLLSGRLKVDGFGRGRPIANDGTFPLTLEDGSAVREAIHGIAVPISRVAMTMVNGRQCALDTPLESGDRLILIPPDVAALWRALHRQGLGMGIGSDS